MNHAAVTEMRTCGRSHGRVQVTVFSQLKQADGTLVEFDSAPPEPVKRPSRWSLSNWPVRWQVLAIVLVPPVSVSAIVDAAASDVEDYTRVHRALALPEHIPVIAVDARDRRSAKAALIAIAEYALNSLTAARR